MKKILFLCSELAGYFVACISNLLKNYNVEILIIRWKINSEAPFDFSFDRSIKIFEKEGFSRITLKEICLEFNPDLVYVAGWTDRDYLPVARALKQRKITIIGGLDNIWESSFKAVIKAKLISYLIRGCFTHLWVAGIRQYEYAKKLGFTHQQILLDLYSADVDLFKERKMPAKNDYPHKLLYVGRFLDWKGIGELYTAFKEIKEEEANNWELILVGNGLLADTFEEVEGIKIKSFLQPSELIVLAEQIGAFCLPSWKENWGVVVHEFAAAGVPIIASNNVNAAIKFVKNGYNGFVFKAKDKDSLKQQIRKVMELPNEQLLLMGQRSRQLSTQINPDIWSSTLMSVLR